MITKLIPPTLAALCIAVLQSTAFAAEADLLETLRPSALRAIGEFTRIEPARQAELREVAAFVTGRTRKGQTVELTFICTHNSRRSHLAQLWAQTAACYYGATNVTTYSGGTEVAACNIRTVKALRRAGFSIVQSTTGTNPVYLAQFSDTRLPVKMFSKVFTDAANPRKDFAALFSCDQAADKCPVVEGAAFRLPVPYTDPKASDNTPAEAQTYDERSQQIAREMFYLFAQVGKRQ